VKHSADRNKHHATTSKATVAVVVLKNIENVDLCSVEANIQPIKA